MNINLKLDLYQFLSQESPKQLKRLIGFSILLGLTNTVLIAVINAAAKDVADGESVTIQFFLYVLLITLFLLFARRSNQENIQNSRDIIYRFRIRIMRDVFRSSLTRIDEIGRHHIIEVMARDTQMVSQAIVVIVTTFQSIATLVFLTLYLATVSMTAFFIILVASILIVLVGATKLVSVTSRLSGVAKDEERVNALYSDFLNGYKEIKMHSKRAYEMTYDLMSQTKAINNGTTEVIVSITNFFNYLQVLLYVVVGIMIFVVPVVVSDFSSSVTTATTTALFLAGSLAGIITSIPHLSQANVAARSLRELSRSLEQASEPEFSEPPGTYDEVDSIALHEVSYQHGGHAAATQFLLGPVSYTFDKGKVYFIRGNNGSGKTTLMRVLIGLYRPSQGQILVNQSPISLPASSQYRDIFSVVFSDFFLFKKLYGLVITHPEETERLLDLFKIQHKVSIINGEFSDLQFSTGQRKRIALIVALLEKRQFLVLDEWAADQDPEFRREFYQEIIPAIRDMGKTIIAITHDDRYYEMADHVLHMVDGKLLVDQ